MREVAKKGAIAVVLERGREVPGRRIRLKINVHIVVGPTRLGSARPVHIPNAPAAGNVNRTAGASISLAENLAAAD